MHHPIFDHFERFKGFVPAGYHTDLLGVMTRNAFTVGMNAENARESPDPIYVETDYPTLDEEYLEWVDLLESACDAQQQFTMIELGAGYGRWLVRGATAVRRYHGDLPIRLVGVEAEPKHFEWLKQHFVDNSIYPEEHELIEAAVDEQERTIHFFVGKPDEWYGQRIAQPHEKIEDLPVREVKTITLRRILSGLDLVDLIDLDVEGAELVVLRSAIEELNRKVRRVHIGTHAPDIEQGLRTLFWKHGWYKRNDYAVGKAELTEWGEIYFGNGVQTWINPRLLSVQPSSAELMWLQWAIRSSDFRYANLQDELHKLHLRDISVIDKELTELRQQLDQKNYALEAQKHEIVGLSKQLDGWQKHWQSVEGSAGWRLLSAWRRVRDGLAPEGTRRRRVYDSAVGLFRPVPR